jgi:hypothetical protein
MRSKIMLVTVACALTAGCGSTADHATSGQAADTSVVAPANSSAVPAATSLAATAAPNDELKTAVQAYSDAFLTGDGKTAYELLSERCRKRTTLAEFSGIVEAAKSTYGSALPIETFSASVSSDLARVTYTYSIKAINQDSEPWVRENGSWHEDDC